MIRGMGKARDTALVGYEAQNASQNATGPQGSLPHRGRIKGAIGSQARTQAYVRADREQLSEPA